MKKIMAAVLALFLCFATVGCGSDMTINGRTYETKGLISQNEKDPCVRYRTIVGNVVWGIILVETLIAPVYFFGFSLWEPAGLKPECVKKSG